jgi:hypothetical protein
MAAYAHGLLETTGLSWSINAEERQKIKIDVDVFWPPLMINRKWAANKRLQATRTNRLVLGF